MGKVWKASGPQVDILYEFAVTPFTSQRSTCKAHNFDNVHMIITGTLLALKSPPLRNITLDSGMLKKGG